MLLVAQILNVALGRMPRINVAPACGAHRLNVAPAWDVQKLTVALVWGAHCP